MNKEEIADEARKAANRSQFKSNHIYDYKSYEDGFIEGMTQSLSIANVVERSEQLAAFVEWLDGEGFPIPDRKLQEYIKYGG